VTIFNSFALQFTNVTAAGLANTGAHLIITESGLTSAPGTPATLTATELASLAASGKIVVAYVNTCVTDAARAYWDPTWVTPTNPTEPDVGTVNPNAPAWLQNNLGGVDFNPAYPGDEAIRVNYRDPAWRAMVVAQAVAQVQAGYGGVFLDDVGQYFQAGYATGTYDPSLADSMMQLVIDVSNAVKAINPNAQVIVNSGVFIGGDSSAGTPGALFTAYHAAIDGMIIENQFHSETPTGGVLSTAAVTYTGVSILALESAALLGDPGRLLEFAGTHGILPYVVPTEAYDSFVPSPILGTSASNILTGRTGFANIIGGLAGNDKITGGSKADQLYGHSGNDTVNGSAGNDTLDGGLGNDSVIGGLDNDRVLGGAGNDRIYGQDGDDRLFGQSGNDVLSGGAGNDQISGGLGNDLLYGGAGHDAFVFAPANGADRVYDFTQGEDRLNLHALGTTLPATLAALSLTSTGVLLDLTQLGGTGSVLLIGQTDLAAFTAADFIL
jgi:uncharacterized protein (TIGR01370 family)